MNASCPTCNRSAENLGYWKGLTSNKHIFECKKCRTKFEVAVNNSDQKATARVLPKISEKCTCWFIRGNEA